MAWPVTVTKFVGTISLGLLTGISYNSSTITLPSLALLPTAVTASRTLAQIQTATTRQVLTIASISSLSLVACYTLAPATGKHPYLLWTALMACLGGQGVEYYYNGLRRFPSWRSSTGNNNNSNASKSYVMVEGDDEQSVNGEKVEMEMSRERRVQGVRALVSGIGFAMGMVGIWGDGA